MKNRFTKKLTLSLIFILPLVTACSGLLSKQPLNTVYYSLDAVESKQLISNTGISNTNKTLPTLIVYPPKAAAGYDTRHMMYSRSSHQLEYFARSEWIATPSHMLQPLMVAAIEKTNAYNAVLLKPSTAVSDLRLESEVVKLLQDFNHKPSTVQFTLRATIINNATNKVVAMREFDEQVIATTDDPTGGVAAANQAVNIALQKLGEFAKESAMNF